MSARIEDALIEKARFTRVYEVLCCTREELLAIPRFGETSLQELYEALDDAGFPVPASALPPGNGEENASGQTEVATGE